MTTRYATSRPQLDHVSWNAMNAATRQPASEPDYRTDDEATDDTQPPEDVLWAALCAAPRDGWTIGELMVFTGMPRATLYRHLREHAIAHRAFQVTRGRWRARTPDDDSPQ